MDIKKSILSNYLKIVFIFSLGIGYLLMPEHIAPGYLPLIVAFVLTFATTMTISIKVAKEQFKEHHGQSAISVLSSFVGIVAINTCSAALACGTIMASLIAVLLPSFAVPFMAEFGIYVVLLSMLLQLIGLYRMRSIVH